MAKKLLLSLAVIIVVAAVGWANRIDLILFAISKAGKIEVAETQQINWDQGPAAAVPGQSQPNIIFILADDMGINDISTFGGGMANGTVKTPNIDRLAADGAIFTQSYAGTGTCAPSRAMLMTGRYPTRTGFEFTPTPPGMSTMLPIIASGLDRPEGVPLPVAQDNDVTLSYEEMGLPSSEVTIAELLKAQGYHTVHIGKWHLGRNPGSNANDQGFDESLLMTSGLFLEDNDPNGVSAKLDFDPIDRFLWARMQFANNFNNGPAFKPGGYLTDYWTDESLKVIEANKNRPFFLYLAHWGIHTPLQATKEDYEAVGDIKPHRARVYAAMMRSLDRSVGRIMDKLEETGQADNTIIVFSSDNGGAGYIGLPEVNAPYRGYKITLFEGGIRVPLFIKWPGKIKPGTVIDNPVAHIDVMPTLAAAGNAPLPEGVEIDGVNLLPAAQGTGAVARAGDAIFWQSGFYKVMRKGDWKLQVNERQDKIWLFDLANDPTEQVNLADSAPDMVAELKAVLDAHHADARPPLWPHTLEAPTFIDKTLADDYEQGDEFIIWPN